jgi:hypothetical protein
MHTTQIRQTLRRLWKSRGFSFCVVLTLGIGIGATASVFSIIYAVLLRPLPYFKPAELMSLSASQTPNDETTAYGFSPANFNDFRARNRSFTDLAAYFAMYYTLIAHGEPELLEGTAVSAASNVSNARSEIARLVHPITLISRLRNRCSRNKWEPALLFPCRKP